MRFFSPEFKPEIYLSLFVALVFAIAKKLALPWNDMVCSLQQNRSNDLEQDVVGGETGQEGPERHSDQPGRPRSRRQILLSRCCRPCHCCSRPGCRRSRLLQKKEEGPLLQVGVLGKGGQLGALLVQQENLG